MLKIGDFSKLSRISIRMLRHYDEIGLLVPYAVDDFTGYRYYSEDQLPAAGRIQALKNLGFGLSEIGEMLNKYEDTGEMEHLLTKKRQELVEEDQQLKARIRLLESTIDWLKKDGTMLGYEVSLKTIKECQAACVRQVIPTYAHEGILWQILKEDTAGISMKDGTPRCSMAVYHDKEYKDRDVDMEIQRTVSGRYADTGRVKFKTLPQVQAASVVFRGSYDLISRVNVAVARWIFDNGYELDGLSFNIYHVGPGDTKNPEDYVTEVCFPVRKK